MVAVVSLQELFATWQSWNVRDVAEQAARRAEGTGLDEQAAVLRGPGEGPRAGALADRYRVVQAERTAKPVD